MAEAVSIGIAVVEHDGRYLVGVRGPDGPLPGKAEFPGGKCRPGESPRDAAVRECREEASLDVAPLSLLDNVRFEYPHGTLQLSFWLCRPCDGGSISDSHGSFRWATAAELRTLDFPAANAKVVEKLLRGDQVESESSEVLKTSEV